MAWTSKWLKSGPALLVSTTGKTSKSSSAGFATAFNKGFECESDPVGEAMRNAICRLGNICPPDLDQLLDKRLREERNRLARLRLTTVADVDRWAEGWRILISEALIEQSKEPQVYAREASK